MTISVSIVIPVYNVAGYIEHCLHSVAMQSYKNLEVILVDDCGTDESMSIAENYFAQYTHINAKIVRHERNRGLSAARNTGLQVATGDYVYFLDSDDELINDAIATMVAPLLKESYDFVIANYEVIGSDKSYPALSLPEGSLKGTENILKSYSESQWYMMAWNKLCRRNFLLENHLFFKEGLLHEDVVWSFQLACKAKSMFVIQQQTYQYKIRGASIMTGTSIEKDAAQYIRVFEAITHFVQEEKLQFKSEVYHVLEGRKSTLLFSLLQKKEKGLFNKYYPLVYCIPHISPMLAFKNGIIGAKYLLRDFHYLLPLPWGRIYKYLFYNLLYKWRAKPIEGALW